MEQTDKRAPDLKDVTGHLNKSVHLLYLVSIHLLNMLSVMVVYMTIYLLLKHEVYDLFAPLPSGLRTLLLAMIATMVFLVMMAIMIVNENRLTMIKKQMELFNGL